MVIDFNKKRKKTYYGRTELHTSIQTAARNFCRKKYDDAERPASLSDILEWIADWTTDNTIEKILETNSLKDMFTLLNSKPGVGNYYGYHCATSNSVNPNLNFQHDEPFCVPGPGAVQSLDKLFLKLKEKQKLPYGDLVIWLRENQHELFDDKVEFHHFFHNYHLSCGTPVFEHQQDELKVYTCEVRIMSIWCL